MVINIITGSLIAIVLKYLKKTLHTRETILTQISADLALALFIFISSACWSIIYRELNGPFKNDNVILFIAAVIQEAHFLLLIIALCLQITTFLFFFFGQKMISWNKSQFHMYRILALTTSIAGTVYYCKQKTGLFAKIPLYYYFFDNTADGRKLVLKNYSYFLVSFMVLVSAMQIAIEWRKRQLKQKDQIAKARASEASQRLSLARVLTKFPTQSDKEKIQNSNVFSSMPSLTKTENDVFKEQNQSRLFLYNFTWNSIDSTLAIDPKHASTRTTGRAKFISKVTPYPLNSDVPYIGKRSMFLKKANSCPNLQNILVQSEQKDKKLKSQNMAKVFTRAISIFIVFPTLFLVGNVILGGFELAKPHSNTIVILSFYGILTPLAYILGKPNVREVLMTHLKI